MSAIKLTIEDSIVKGKQVSFKAPCDSANATSVLVNDVSYDIVDAVGDSVLGVPDVWSKDAIISVILNPNTQKAYIQNPKPTLTQLGAIGFKRLLTSADDFNNLTEEGVYSYLTGTASNPGVPKNCPYSNAGIVEVIKSDGDTTRIIQRVTRYGKAGTTSFRTLFDGTWQPWTEFAMKEDITFGNYEVRTTGQDLNNYTTPGVYFFNGDYTPSNTPPDNNNGWVQVFANNSRSMVKQTWYRGGKMNSNDHQTYIRTYINGSGWSNWHAVDVAI